MHPTTVDAYSPEPCSNAPLSPSSQRPGLPCPLKGLLLKGGSFDFSPMCITAPNVTPNNAKGQNFTGINGPRLQSHLWNSLTGHEFRSRILPAPTFTPQSTRTFGSVGNRSLFGGNPCSPVSLGQVGESARFRPSELFRKLDARADSPPLSARSGRTDVTVESVAMLYPEVPDCEHLCTDSLVIESKMMNNAEVEAATQRLLDAVKFIKKLYAASSRATAPTSPAVWVDTYDEFLQTKANNEYEQAVTAQLDKIRSQLEGKRAFDSIRSQTSVISTGTATLSEAWFEHVSRLRAPGALMFDGPGDLQEILSGKNEAHVSRERTGQVINGANGGLTVVEAYREHMTVSNCNSSQVSIVGTCKSLQILDCDNCSVLVGSVETPVRMRNCQKVQLLFKGASQSVIVE